MIIWKVLPRWSRGMLFVTNNGLLCEMGVAKNFWVFILHHDFHTIKKQGYYRWPKQSIIRQKHTLTMIFQRKWVLIKIWSVKASDGFLTTFINGFPMGPFSYGFPTVPLPTAEIVGKPMETYFTYGFPDENEGLIKSWLVKTTDCFLSDVSIYGRFTTRKILISDGKNRC